MAEDINVLVVDDSALMRKLVSTMVEQTPGLHVVDTAMNGKLALEKIPKLEPDAICLDLEMPEMNGIEFLRERKKRGITIPVIVLSSIAEKGASVTMEALTLGASDFVTKPSGAISVDVAKVKDRVSELLLAYGGKYRRYKKPNAPLPPMPAATLPPPHAIPDKKIVPITKPGKVEVIAIGISTGGPEALRVVFANLDPDLKVPILVVQHMPAGFTLEFARSLDKICPLEVKEAEEGEMVVPGRILIAEGSKHLELERVGIGSIVHLSDTPPVSGHKPSADVLFASAALGYRNHVLGVIMTGMGRDGAAQLGSIYREGGLTLGQDEKSSIVYGMPRVAFEMGHVMEQVPLSNMGQRISQVAKCAHL
jgi:two-component system chemotaxis response regulator CheB